MKMKYRMGGQTPKYSLGGAVLAGLSNADLALGVANQGVDLIKNLQSLKDDDKDDEDQSFGGGGMYKAQQGARVSPTGPMLRGEERMTYPPRAMGRDPFASEQYFAEKGTAAELRKMGRQNRRAANQAYRQQPRGERYYVPEPSQVQNVLTGLETDRFNREAMVDKGFRNESARMLARNALLAALGLGVSEYSKTPKTVQAPIGASGQTYDVDLNALQRIAYMLGLGPY